ncbi:MAG: hypothetical protein ACOC0P_07380 [Planctomycetota bacterium]
MQRILASIAAVSLLAPVAVGQQQQVLSRAEVYSRLVNTSVEANFTQTPMRNVIEYFSAIGNVDILPTWAEDEFGDGFDPEANVSLQLKNKVPLIDAIELVMNQVSDDDSTWTLGDGFVKIGPKELLNQDKYVVIYPIRELLFVAPLFENAPQLDLQSVLSSSDTGEINQNIFDDQNDDDQGMRVPESEQADELIDIITSIVDTYQWEINGGDGGSIRYFRGNLIVNAADYLHRQIGGYPFPTGVVRSMGGQASMGSASSFASGPVTPRYVTLTGRFANTRLIDVEQYEVPVLVNGSVVLSGGGG